MDKEVLKKQAIVVLIILASLFGVIYLKVKYTLDFNYYFLGIAILLGLLVYPVLGFRWYVNSKLLKSKRKFGLTEMTEVEAISKYAKYITPFQLNIPFRAIYFKKYGVEMTRIISISLFELFIELFISIFVIIVGYTFIYFSLSWQIWAVFILMILSLIFMKQIVRIIDSLFRKTKIKLVRKLIRVIDDVPQTLKLYLKNPFSLFLVVITTFFFFVLRGIRIYFIAASLGIGINMITAVVAVVATLAISSISRIPGGLGITEATGVFLLRGFASEGEILTIFLVDRVITSIFVLVFGNYLLFFKYNKVFDFKKIADKFKK